MSELYNNTISLIKEWVPKQHKGELMYRDELLNLLRKKLNQGSSLFTLAQSNIIVKKEDGRGLCDIAIEREVGIELKLNLNSKSKVDRLYGQIDEYLKNYKYIIVVLLGKTSTEALEYLKEKVRKINEENKSLLMEAPKVKIIVKDNKKQTESPKERSPFNIGIKLPKFDFGI